MRKPFTVIAVVLLALIALLQSVRLVMGWVVMISGFVIPLWASGVAAVIAAALAVLVWRERRERD